MATRSIPVGDVRRLGDHALLMGVPDAVAARRLTRALTAARLDGVAEVVGGLATVMVAFDPVTVDVDVHRPVLAHLMEETFSHPGHDEEAGAVLFEIPCTFDGPDLAEVAMLVGSTPEGVVALLTAAPLTVAVVGFSPGFAYLAGLPAALCQVPRRARPRPAVPAGSVALANGHAAVYPSASPGGWQLIGHTDVPLFTPSEPPYARLAPGDRVQFGRSGSRSGGTAGGAAGRSTAADSAVRGTTALPSGTRPVFDVEEPGLRSVLQDGGRRGLSALGVPAATPADPDSFRLANELVGNPVGACTLEVTASGPTLRCLSPCFVAVVGGSPDLRLQGQPVEAGRVVPVTPGQQLMIGPVRTGLRSYVALAGGFVGPVLLGSSSSDQLTGLGPGPIVQGAQLLGATMEPPLGDHLSDGASKGVEPGGPVALRVVPGPHHERFAPGTFAALASMRFTVEAASNRVGLRLRHDPRTPALRAAPGAPAELDSQGMVTGAVQVPPDGEPVILLTDHATLGGYPVVAVVAAVDHGLLGQCAPGTTVVLVPCDHDAAADALREHRRALDLAVVGHYPLAVD